MPTSSQPANGNNFMPNVTFLFKLTRVMLRIGTTTASGDTGLSEKTIRQFEANKLKAGCCDTLNRMGIYLSIQYIKFEYDTLPPQAYIDELEIRGQLLGRQLRTKKIPKPGTRAAAAIDTEWLQWGLKIMEDVYGKELVELIFG